METLPLMLHLRSLCLLWLLVFINFATSFNAFENLDDPSVVYTYNRFAEIQEKCGPVLSSASELKPDDDRGNRIKKELSFVNGDWEQESGRAPLMLFDDTKMHRNPAGPGSFLKLASFWVVDVDPVRRAKNMVSVSGIMQIGITGYGAFNYRPGWLPKFRKGSGYSSMTIIFEGVYIESEENGGERLICLLGTSMMPTTNQSIPSQDQSIRSQDLADMYGYKFEEQHQHPLVQDDQIMLVLRYNQIFSLTKGNITGEMKSLHEKADYKYFDRVHLSSHLGLQAKYQFGAEELLSNACSPYPYQDSLVDEDVVLFKDDKICDTLSRLVSHGMFLVVPSWKSVGSNDDANKLGPFILNRTTKDIDGGLNYFRLIVQSLLCNQEIDENITTAKVFAIFRVIHSWEDGYTSVSRTGLSGFTLAAEGIWRSAEGQLCMVGCLGVVGTTSERCNSRICLHFPLTFSITQRTTVFGSITSINDTDSHTPLWFEKESPPDHITSHGYERNPEMKWSYKYSKIMQAKAFQTRSKEPVLGTLLRKFLVYPSPYDGGISSLSSLADELSLSVSAVPYAFAKAQTQKTCVTVTLHVLSSGSLFGRYRPRRNGSYQEVEQSHDFNTETIEISGHLIIFGENFSNISLSFEGIYDSAFGKMYLIGCRDVRRIFQKNIKEEMNLDCGMDCQFEVKVEYPPRDTRWLKNPEVRISISSKRSKEDPLYFNPVNLKTAQIYYEKQFPDMIFRKIFEDILRVLFLIMAIGCTRSQLHYINSFVDPIAYISLVLIFIPTVDYISPLNGTGESFFKWKSFHAHSHITYEIMRYERFRILDYVIQVLSLYAFLLTFNLAKKVSASHSRQLGHGHKKKSRLPNEKKIFIITSAVHIMGFLFTLIIHEMNAVEMVSQPDKFVYGRIKLLQWLKELDGYLLLVPNFFLLPQIIANTLWWNKGKPLRKLYYMGLTCLRVLLHVYDYIRDPVSDHNYGLSEYQNMNLDSYSKFGNIVVAVIVIVLAMIVYKQQNSNSQEFIQEAKAEERNDAAALKPELYESFLS